MVEISDGTNASQIVQELNEKEILNRPFYMKVLIKLKRIEGKLQAGYYEFQKPTHPIKFLSQLISGEVEVFKHTIVEGWTFREWVNDLAKQPHLRHELKDLSMEEVCKLVSCMNNHIEGLLYPNTYYYHKNTSDIELLKKAYLEIQKLLDSLSHALNDLPYKSMYEILIVASILEKETAYSDERKLISDIIIRRLKKRMLLQLDPTIIYAQNEKAKATVKKINLSADTLYNTYLHHGLPPTPICFPSKDAILSAISPKQNEYLYFVSDQKGRHIFSKTLKEHHINVKKMKQSNIQVVPGITQKNQQVFVPRMRIN